MNHTYIVIPQWQGSSSPRALGLIAGAEAVRAELLPASADVRLVPVPTAETATEDPSGHGSVRRLDALARVRADATALLADVNGVTITVGGDCAADQPSVERALRRNSSGDGNGSSDGNGMALVWLDAHGDINTPASSPSGAYHGMVVRGLLGDGPAELAAPPDARLTPDRLVLAGTRSLDAGERTFIEATGIRMLPVAELTPDALVAAVRATGARSVYVHIDLDVLDPAHIAGIGFPEPGGLSPDRLVELVGAVREAFDFAGGAVTEFCPDSPAGTTATARDLDTVRRILTALAGAQP
ncbi:arginase family protein [Allostreptomyces psammosilenae]|uniref:Arginase n=1 Tax=Allostreptomyces psammosilenae TaxID=1892865 RepID=A0A853A700_9ACTN|nr:arginase family protein [Allostreptomyces psammosilenae]NYI06451.1 arginase [Allostreptomyces psammosilenae]